MRPKILGSAILGLTVAVTTPAVTGELVHLADRHFTCKKGELRLHGDRGSTRYPPGKREKMRLPTKIGILSYTCRYVRSIVSCPIDTTVVIVERSIYQGRFDVACLGVPKVSPSGFDRESATAPPDQSGGPEP
jgi:hypothetical protein